MGFSSFSRRLAIRLGAALVIGWLAAPASAQVLEVGDDGTVTVYDAPAVITSEGSKPLAGVAFPSLATTLAVPTVGSVAPTGTMGQLFAWAAEETGVDARLLHAVAWRESRFRQAAVSNKGAIGIMQLMPETARGLGVDPHDVVQNVRGGARLLGRLLRLYAGNVDLTLAAYNAGSGAVQRYGGIPPFAETRAYVAQIKQMLIS